MAAVQSMMSYSQQSQELTKNRRFCGEEGERRGEGISSRNERNRENEERRERPATNNKYELSYCTCAVGHLSAVRLHDMLGAKHAVTSQASDGFPLSNTEQLKLRLIAK